MQPLGTPGNARRRFFPGPGMDNTDLALLKNFSLSQARSLQLRLESFNTFNHAQLLSAGAVDGNISSATFGQAVSAASPRIVQVAAKVKFPAKFIFGISSFQEFPFHPHLAANLDKFNHI